MEHQSNDQHIRGSLNPALRNPLLLVVILVVLTESGFRFSLNISQLLAKAIPVRGAKFKKPAFRAGFLLFCVREIIGWRLHLTRPT
ncbi:hypothetical protein [Enterobacter hormaechei]|uniref:hypothetical protein n=2 Tax=Enterobacter TaxID=547 RepID=UPI0036D4041B